MPAVFPSSTNTFVASHEATGGLIVGFSRNVNRFKINQYRQIIPVDKPLGVYLSLTSQEAARVTDSNDNKHLWPDGHDAPTGVDELESFSYSTYRTDRRAYPFTLGNISIEAASWNIVAYHSEVAAQKAMTAKTMLAYSALSSTSWGNNTATPATIVGTSGKNWSNGSTGIGSENQKHILKSLNYASVLINQATLGVVQPKEMILVVNPNTARIMSESAEIQWFVAQSPFAQAQLRGDTPSLNGQWGLPDMLYGHQVVVEDTVVITASKGQTANQAYVFPDNVAYLLSRPKGLEGMAGSPNYSTLQTFVYQDELTAQIKSDPDNERTVGRVVTNFAMVVTSPLAGFAFTSVLGG